MIKQCLQHLQLPMRCAIDKVIFKKTFSENGQLSAADKKALSDDVQKIYCNYVLKAETAHIEAYQDSQRDYSEVLILSALLHHDKRHKRIADFIHKSIPYPVLLLLQHGDHISLSTADKRINQADKEKTVTDKPIYSPWLNPSAPNAHEAAFMQALSPLSNTHMLAFYEDITARLVALQCAAHSGHFTLPSADNSTAHRIAQLQEIEGLQADKKALHKAIKTTTQMGKQVALMQQIKQITDQIAILKKTL